MVPSRSGMRKRARSSTPAPKSHFLRGCTERSICSHENDIPQKDFKSETKLKREMGGSKKGYPQHGLPWFSGTKDHLSWRTHFLAQMSHNQNPVLRMVDPEDVKN